MHVAVRDAFSVVEAALAAVGNAVVAVELGLVVGVAVNVAKQPLFTDDERVALIAAGLDVPDRMPDMDALVAATALAHGLTLVTRNLRDMERTGAALLNPWDLAG